MAKNLYATLTLPETVRTRYYARIMQFVVLGTHPELSRAELAAILHLPNPPLAQRSVVLLSDEHVIPFERLAGAIKVGKILDEVASPAHVTAERLLTHLCLEQPSRADFGISIYDAGDSATANALASSRRKLGLAIKQHLKDAGRSARFVEAKEQELSSVVVDTNHLVSRAGELCLIVMKKKILIGRTSAVQDFRGWSVRDFGRPSRDATSGMLPPKLARLMINLSGTEPSKTTLLDPFCGSGTVLMEALLLGCKRVIGSDASAAAVKATGENLGWLEHKRKEPMRERVKLFVSDAAELGAHLSEPVDLIVSELYLGPPQSGRESPAQLKKIRVELEQLYARTLSKVLSNLTSDGTAVLAFPHFNRSPQSWSSFLHSITQQLNHSITPPLLYSRPTQHVGREIFVIKK